MREDAPRRADDHAVVVSQQAGHTAHSRSDLIGRRLGGRFGVEVHGLAGAGVLRRIALGQSPVRRDAGFSLSRSVPCSGSRGVGCLSAEGRPGWGCGYVGQTPGNGFGEAAPALTEVPGNGPWSAHGFLLVALDRPDVFLTGDVALRRAIQRLYGFDHVPTQDELIELSDCWRPYRSLAVSYVFASEYAG